MLPSGVGLGSEGGEGWSWVLDGSRVLGGEKMGDRYL